MKDPVDGDDGDGVDLDNEDDEAEDDDEPDLRDDLELGEQEDNNKDVSEAAPLKPLAAAGAIRSRQCCGGLDDEKPTDGNGLDRDDDANANDKKGNGLESDSDSSGRGGTTKKPNLDPCPTTSLRIRTMTTGPAR